MVGAAQPHRMCPTWQGPRWPLCPSSWPRHLGAQVPSEDALVTAEYGVYYATGMQYGVGGNRTGYLQTVCEPKHFFGYDLEGSGPNLDKGPPYHADCTTGGEVRWQTVENSGYGNTTPNTCRYAMNGRISQRDLVEYYLRPWHAVITRADPQAIMCAYPSVNGQPGCGNKEACRPCLALQGRHTSDKEGTPGCTEAAGLRIWSGAMHRK